MTTAESFGVRLKRKVLSAETKLFEWRPCSCSILARDGKLLLQLQTPPQDEDAHSELENETETVTIDLATQLLNVVPKKNKARCDLEYYAPVATMSGQVLKEELMAPSATHCQQWITQVRRVQQQAHQQRRPTSSASTRSGASPVAPLPSPLTSHNGGSSQAELHILQRVEAALRALELENAQAKTRERELVQEIQTLRDGARVAAAERKHIEQEYRHARREVDSWRRAAQSAEAAAAQLQEQLGIAREENQLLAGEKMRLKRQNSELLNQVHRLDSLVYGRF
ncbi:hypothetical protein PHYSODRAFT_315293 [Phytophthora sojae]|uniref:Uncharacterized protein n=1 Tax=Phytophthora sojae (strain P6497) TaxID=1094619 RepID=G4ZHL1_PHYSP|nr:hypothetical protein PHYSODRAFT_315293 [Phytophthora sojae]EGZ18666.1 hypothetical protein PHYSODRAFT_315293 [Phytophthora sojae]|eukprot:XP_009527724.1 hypothetical protein PHYSODRAFT_315293 [Phytophthora sojae]